MKHHLSCLKGDTIKAIILVCLAVGVVGMSYGSLAMAYGFPVWVPFVLSITVLAGASEFMFIGIVAAAVTRWRRGCGVAGQRAPCAVWRDGA
jgi:predicted branched-subunit amino acid permease